MTPKSNNWLGNSFKKSLFNTRTHTKDKSQAEQEQFFLDPHFIANECLAHLSSTIHAFFLSSFLILPLISYTSSFLFRQQKHVFHLQHFLIPEMNVDLF